MPNHTDVTEEVTPAPRPRRRRFFQSQQPSLRVSEKLPYALSCTEAMKALNMRSGLFFKAQREGRLRRFEFVRPVDPKLKYSGVLITKYLQAGADLMKPSTPKVEEP